MLSSQNIGILKRLYNEKVWSFKLELKIFEWTNKILKFSCADWTDEI